MKAQLLLDKVVIILGYVPAIHEAIYAQGGKCRATCLQIKIDPSSSLQIGSFPLSIRHFSLPNFVEL